MTPVTSNVFVPAVSVLPIGSAFPKYLAAIFSVKIIFFGSINAVLTSPFLTLNVKISKRVEST